MVKEANASGAYVHLLSDARYPRIQILTIPELMSGKRPNMPTAIMPNRLAKKRFRQLSML